MDEQDKRTERPSVPLSPRELALVNRARGALPKGTWLREAVLEKLAREGAGVTDEARRPTARRRNLSERRQ
jgi:hypothetical protein